MIDQSRAGKYVGQVERDPDGLLWAVLYNGNDVLVRERARSLREAKRRVTDLVLAAADNSPIHLSQTAPTHRHRLVDQRPPASSLSSRPA